MTGTAEIPDVRFWGMIVKSGDRGVYQIDNEHGLMEMCHLTNVALDTDETHGKPIKVMVRSPEDDNVYTIGVLSAGKVFSFATDLVITPDTQFFHTGTGKDEVHLTGYRSISADELLLEDEDEEDEGTEESEEDRGESTGSEDEAGSIEDEEDMEALMAEAQRRIASKLKRRAAGAAHGAMTNGLRTLDKRISGQKIQASSLEELDIDADALAAQQEGGGVDDEEGTGDLDEGASELSSEDDEMEDMDILSGSEGEDEGEERRRRRDKSAAGNKPASKAAITAARKQADKVNAAKARQAASDDPEGEDEFDVGDLFAPSPASGRVASEGSGSSGSEEGEGEAAKQGGSGVAAVAPGTVARTKKNRRDSQEAVSPVADGAPAKKAKIQGVAEAPSPATVHISFPAHPEGTDASTKAYVESLARVLKENSGRLKMSVLGIKLKRPSHLKFGQEEMVLLLK